MSALAINGTSGNDRLIVTATGVDSGSYSLNGGPAVAFGGVTSFAFEGGEGNDVLTIFNPDGGLFAPAEGISYHAGGQPADALELFGGAATDSLYAAGATPDAGTLAYTDSSATQTIAFTGIAPVDDTTSVTNYTFTAPASSNDTIFVTDGGQISGQNTTRISGPTFESQRIANKTNVTINGNGGTDTVKFNNPTPALGLTTFNVNDVDAVTQTGAVNYTNMSFNITGSVNLGDAGNNVSNLAAVLTTASQAFRFRDVDNITLTTVNAVNGVSTNNAVIDIFTDNGPVIVANTAAANDVNAGTSTVSLRAGSTGSSDFAVQLGANANVTGTSGVTLTGDHIDFLGGASVNAGVGTAVLQPFQSGTLIDLGGADAANTLGLTSTEIGDITASTIQVGNSTSGDMVVTGAINPPGTNALTLVTGGTVNESASITITRLVVLAAGGVALNGSNNVSDLAATAGGTFSFSNGAGNPLAIGTLAGVTGITSANHNITLVADNLDIEQQINAGSGIVTLKPESVGQPVNLGAADAAGILGLTDSELDNVTASVLRIDNGVAGISINSQITANSHYAALSLSTGDAIFDGTASEQDDLTVPNLALRGDFGIGSGNTIDVAVSNLAFSNTSNAVQITSLSGPLTIAAVDGLTASSNAGTNTKITAHGALTVATNVTSAGTLTLTSVDTAASGDDVTIDAGVTVKSQTANVLIQAGDDFSLPAGSVIQASTVVHVTLDFGNADPGTGGTAIIAGTISAGSSISINGNSDDDVILISPTASLSGALVLNGDDGSDTLGSGPGADTLDGGSEQDTATYVSSPAGVSVNLLSGSGTGGWAQGDMLTSIENLTGSAFNDTLIGKFGSNVLNGLAGADQLTGGRGADEFVFDGTALADAQSAAQIFDRITDYDQGNTGSFSAGEGDQIDLSAVLAAAFNHGSGQPVSSLVRVLEDPGGTFAKLQIDTDGAANDTNWLTIARLDGLQVGEAVNVILDSPQPAGVFVNVIALNAPIDFNADDFSDIVLRNDDGRLGVWEIENHTLLSGATVSNAPLLDATWHNVGVGDFNADHKADILLRNDDGRVSVWEMDGQSLLSGATVSAAPLLDPTWQIARTGDFNGDGFADIVLRNEDGRVAIWEMNGQTLISGNTVANAPLLDATWHIAETGDFNADGLSDIALRNDDGRVSIWLMNGQSLISGATVSNAPLLDPTWHLAGTGDFNRDGMADIVLRNDDGRISIWEMNGQTLISGNTISNAPLLDPSWHNASTGDFNSDGISDILLRNNDGRISVWEMNGQSLISGATVTGAPLLDPTWHVANHAPDLA